MHPAYPENVVVGATGLVDLGKSACYRTWLHHPQLAPTGRKGPGLPPETQAIASLRKTALNAVHRRLGAKMVDFNGWDMPVEYPSVGGLMKEHLAVRSVPLMCDLPRRLRNLVTAPGE